MKMATTTNTSSVREIKHLRREVSALRSFMIGMAGEDKEGNYNPLVVHEILEAINEPTTHRYSGKGSLLKQVKNV